MTAEHSVTPGGVRVERPDAPEVALSMTPLRP